MVGERLKMARAMAGLTMRDLAEQAGISHQAVGKYEKGTATPSSPVLIRLAKALHVRIESLMRPEVVKLSDVKFRKKKTLPRKELLAIEAQVLDLLERYLLAESLCSDQEPSPPPKYTLKSVEDAEEKAKQWRRDWGLGLGPIENLVETAEAHGIKVVLADAPEGFNGLAVRVEGRMPCLVVNQNLTECRFRLTFAHEMAHIVAAGIEDWPEKQQEQAAFRLGAAFLVPDEAVHRELGTNRRSLDWAELLTLKKIYGLSVQAWIVRASQLGVISDAVKERMFRLLSRQGWRRVEPGDEPTRERSYRFARLLLRAVTEDCVSEERAAEIYGQSLDAFRRSVIEGRIDAACAHH
jgi:Zn-dependent peptidase ImmA (M78 family)/DNA-binding XRE family transcriptional regulator